MNLLKCQCGHCVDLSMEGQKSLRFHKKYLHLYFEDEPFNLGLMDYFSFDGILDWTATMSGSMWLIPFLTPIRLIDGSNSCSGRVEVLYNGTWGTVLDNGWDLPDAAVACREMGCGEAVEAKTAAFFGKGSGLVWLSDLECSNTESRLQDCKSSGWGKGSYGHEKDAGVICKDNVRLVSGISNCSGRVEVLQNAEWGTVCDDGWDVSDAAVVCRQLGCGAVLEVKSAAYFGQGSGSIWMNNVNCFGNESTLMSCSYNRSPAGCGHEKDAGVICGYIKVLLKIEVKASLGVDPNDAGIMDKLSEEIGKKLQINGTLSLKNQTDGKVFHVTKRIGP